MAPVNFNTLDHFIFLHLLPRDLRDQIIGPAQQNWARYGNLLYMLFYGLRGIKS